ncbi:hypothetical protein GE21DRAFT_1324752 [Neurospora crassa]|nr:hypothetical protein GE21DRAFT_1324752 [Neurospora crassa]
MSDCSAATRFKIRVVVLVSEVFDTGSRSPRFCQAGIGFASGPWRANPLAGPPIQLNRAGWHVLEDGRLITLKSLNSGSAPRVWPFGWAGEAHQSRDRTGASTCHSAEAWQWHRPLSCVRVCTLARKGASVSEREAAIPPFSQWRSGPRENANRAAPYL